MVDQDDHTVVAGVRVTVAEARQAEMVAEAMFNRDHRDLDLTWDSALPHERHEYTQSAIAALRAVRETIGLRELPSTPPRSSTAGRAAPGDALTTVVQEAMDWLSHMRVRGIDLTEYAHVKLVHEAEEASDAQSLEEMADVMICLAAMLVRNNWRVVELTQAIHRKTLVNKSRRWRQQPDGTWQHD